MLKTKSVYSPIKKEDGLRILATRIRGRGLKKNRYHVWMANLGPSEKLLKYRLDQPVDKIWNEFKKKYKEEILNSPSIDRNNKNILNHGQKFTLRLIKELSGKQNVTLLCHCDDDQEYCHRHILKELIERV